MRQSRTFAGRADWNEAVRPLGDLPSDQSAKGLFIKRAVPEWGDERRK
jgi:hypothetical protein